jgi:hypothetical protein
VDEMKAGRISKEELIKRLHRIIVLCETMQQAEKVVAISRLWAYMLVANANEEPLDMLEYFEFLSMNQGHIDVHKWDTPIDTKNNTHLEADPVTPYSKVINEFLNPNHKEINFLNLRGYKKNPIPKCFVSHRDWFLLHHHHEDGGIDK